MSDCVEFKIAEPVPAHQLEASKTLPVKPAPVTLVGSVVTLKPMTEEDMPELWAISNGEPYYGHPAYDSDKLIWIYMPAGPYATLEDMKKTMVALMNSSTTLTFCVWHNATGRRIGSISILDNQPQHLCAELGWIWYTPAYQRSPANTESVLLLLRHLFGLSYRRITWKCNGLNERSRKAAAKLGFTFEGVFRQHFIIKGLNRDTYWFSILDSEWAGVEANLTGLLARYAALDTAPAPAATATTSNE